MKIIKPSWNIESKIDRETILKHIENAGRTAYKSEDKITENSASKFVQMIVKRGHLSVLEHIQLSVRIICDRGVSHEIVRHRIASYTQESTRYCNYSNSKFGKELTFIKPCFWKEYSYKFFRWKEAMQHAETQYLLLLDSGATPQEARSVLPNSLKTEIVVTMNLREWLHFFKLRCAKAAHPQMREIAIPIFKEFQKILPEIYGNFNYDKQ